MKPRERVLAALDHRQPDRIPVDFGGHRSSGVAAIAYAKLRARLGLPPRLIRVYDVIQQLAVVDEDVLDRFGVDTIELGRGFALDDGSWAEWVLPDGTQCQVPVWDRPERQGSEWVIRSETGRAIARMPDGALYFEQCHWPFLEEDDLDAIPEALAECMWTALCCPPGPLSPAELADGACQLRARTDRAILGLFGGSLLETGQYLYRTDNFMMLLGGDRERAHLFLARLTDLHLARLEQFLGAVGPFIDIIVFGDDLGMQMGPQMSPAMYRDFFKPHHRRMWQRAKELSDVKVMLHCCGGVRELLPDLIDAGLDAINPVQTSSAGMGPASLKRDFGHAITFWGGGCDTRDVLPHGTPEAICRHVRDRVGVLGPGGGFVFQQVHNILADVPPENAIAMFEAVKGA